MAKTKKNENKDTKALLERSAQTGRFFKREGFEDLSDVVVYAIKRSAA